MVCSARLLVHSAQPPALLAMPVQYSTVQYSTVRKYHAAVQGGWVCRDVVAGNKERESVRARERERPGVREGCVQLGEMHRQLFYEHRLAGTNVGELIFGCNASHVRCLVIHKGRPISNCTRTARNAARISLAVACRTTPWTPEPPPAPAPPPPPPPSCVGSQARGRACQTIDTATRQIIGGAPGHDLDW